MPESHAIYVEKLDQAVALLGEQQIDAWLIFVRETEMSSDPALGLIAPFNLTWESALIVSSSGERIAIVGRFDAEAVKASGLFGEVVGYDAGIGPALRETISR